MRNGVCSRAAGISVLAVFLVAMTVLVVVPPRAAADGGDFSLDFIAAEPYSYDHAVGGGAYDDRTIGVDVVESLEGGDFVCGDTVTYLLKIENAGTPTAANQTAEFHFSFLADTTGQSGAAHIDITHVDLNYGVVSAGDGPGGTDAGIADDGGSRAAILYEYFTKPPFEQKSELMLGVRVDDLEAAEEVVLRIDARLGCIPTRPTGNLQADLLAAEVVEADGEPMSDAIGAGAQTIPFKEIGKLFLSTITVIKVADPPEGSFDFTLFGPEVSDTQTVAANGSYWWSGLVGGTYALTESVPPGWSLDDVSCEGAEWERAGSGASIFIGAMDELDVVCTFWDSQLPGSIIIEKESEPAGATGFVFNGDLGPFTLDDGESIRFDGLMPGGYGIFETVPDGWELTGATCDDGSDPAAIDLDPGETVTCVFENALLPGEIIVEKRTDPVQVIDRFVFNRSYGDSFTLADQEVHLSGPLPPGAYSVSEVVPAGWVLNDISCQTGETSSAVRDGDGVVIDLAPDEVVHCVFDDFQLRGSIEVVKTTDPTSDEDFEFTLHPGDTRLVAGDGGSYVWSHLIAGEYSLAESLTAAQIDSGWSNVAATCDNGDDPSAIALEPGEHVVCTFHNVQALSSITVIKNTDPLTAQPFEFALDDDTVSVVGDGGSYTWTDVEGGHSYSLIETLASDQVSAAWSLDSVSCVSELESAVTPGAAGVEIGLLPGDHVTCTFTNVQPRGSITVIKATVPADPQGFAFILDPGDTQVVSGDGGNFTWPDLITDRYSLSEILTAGQQADGWYLESATCDNGDDPAAIDLDPGEEVVCTFTNYQASDFILEKATDADTDLLFTFEMNGAYLADLGAGQAFEMTLDTGTYTVRELMVDGWDLVDVACLGAEAEVDLDTGSVDLFIPPGSEVTCVFENHEIPALLGAIGDFVWADVDGDGIQDDGEPGVEGVEVELIDANTKLVVMETKSNASGVYVLANVPEGDYFLRFTTPAGWEFTEADQGSDDAVDSDAVLVEEVLASATQTKEVGVTATFHLDAGAADMTRDAGMFKVKVLPQVVTTTTTTTVPETLPFTGGAGGPGLAGLAVAILCLGAMIVLSLRRREDEPLVGWSRRLPEVH